MNELIKRITERTGLSEDQARNAAQTVIGFLKEKLPAGLSGQIDSALGSGQTSGADITKQAGRMFGKGG